jgi:Ring finger domain
MSIVNGLSVSVSVSPHQTPVSSSGNHVSGGPGAPMKKRYEVSAAAVGVIDVIDVSSDEEEEESVSPRVLFPVGGGGGGPSRGVARRLDFYSSGEWSPIPLATASASVARKEKEKEEENPVGDCSVCYASLPARSNHVFTLCGHLFCVKCLLRWWDTAITCPICRANILEAAEEASAAVAVDVSSSESDSDNDNDFVGDDNVGGVDDLPHPSITSFNRYLHLDSLVVWSTAAVTDPEEDDEAVQLSQDERDNIRWSREIALNLFTRGRFYEMLISNSDFLVNGMVHEFIPKQQWIEIGHDQMGPHLMFEFVMCGTASYNAPMETNFFGYISSIVVVRVERPAARVIGAHAVDDDWENSHEYAFIVHVFSPVAPYGRYDIDDGTFETAELLFRFSDIRRMYSMSATA